MAFPTSTSPKVSSKTIPTKALAGIPHYQHTGTLTTTRPKPSRPIIQSKLSPCIAQTRTSPLIANSDTQSIGSPSLAIGVTNSILTTIRANSASLGWMHCVSILMDLQVLRSRSCKGRKFALIVRRLVLFGMFWCRGIWTVESLGVRRDVDQSSVNLKLVIAITMANSMAR